MPLSIGIVGAGEIVDKVHLPVLLSLPELRVAWVTDKDEKRSRQVARAFGIPHAALPADPQELPAADLILIAIPYGPRRPYLEAFRQRSCGVYLEKPLARTVAEHRELCGWFGEHRLASGFQRRSWGPMQLVRNAIRAGLFGRLLSMRFTFGRRGQMNANLHHGDIAVVGGGVLLEAGIHGVDAMLYIADGVSVACEKRMIMDGPFDIHTDARLAITTSGGERVSAELIVTCLEDTEDRLEFHCENAALSLALFGDGQVMVAARGARSPGMRLEPNADGEYPLSAVQTNYAHWKSFLAALETGVPNAASASTSILTTAVIEDLYREGDASSRPHPANGVLKTA